jgi:hypothetical protein
MVKNLTKEEMEIKIKEECKKRKLFAYTFVITFIICMISFLIGTFALTIDKAILFSVQAGVACIMVGMFYLTCIIKALIREEELRIRWSMMEHGN